MQFSFKMNNFESKASLMDLPCIIESHKTLDSVNLFKSNNISQMIYVHPNNEDTLEEGKKSYYNYMLYVVFNLKID